jgi:anti-sigma regulatory factor (Ser/Thr protein kinase)
LLTALETARDETFSHEALLYAGLDGFVESTAAFIREGAEAGEAVLVVVAQRKINLLREALNGSAERVVFADMAKVGANPALIINAWRRFVDEQRRLSGPLRGVGEPIWAGRSADELEEAQRHEVLLNVAFSGTGPWSLLCPYDIETLPAAVIEEAARSHPVLRDGMGRRASGVFADQVDAVFSAPLPPAPADAFEVVFADGGLDGLRALVFERAMASGLSLARSNELVLAVNELATNSLRYGGGGGVLRLWEAGGGMVCEVADRGRITDPLVGRLQPGLDREGGRGLWLANQLCDLVQIRSGPSGSTVRLHQRA